LLHIWKTFEENHGSPEDVKKIEGMMPIQARVRHVDQETGQMVEGPSLFPSFRYHSCILITVHVDWDFVFADDEREAHPTSFKFMQMAHAWKQSQAKAGGAGGTSGLLAGFTAAKATAESESEEEGESDGDEKSDVASSEDEEE
jgi:crooked neck